MYHKITPLLLSERRARFSIDTCEPQTLAVRSGKIKMTALTKGHYPGVPIPGDVLPGLNSIGFWDGVGQQDWGLNPHRNEGIEIHYLETGKMAFTVDDRQFDLHSGDFTVTKPWQLHKLGDPNMLAKAPPAKLDEWRALETSLIEKEKSLRDSLKSS